MGAVLSALHGLNCGGDADFVRGIQIAQLALKHRMNKNQKQRIVAFVGSPLKCPEKQLLTLGKQLKKNNVALDLISFGEVEKNAPKLKVLHEAVDSNGSSCLLECVPESGQLLSDFVLRSSLLRDPETGAGPRGVSGVGDGAGGGDAAAMNEFGVDPNADPELYMALQLSLQEEQNRAARMQEQRQAEEGGSGAGGAPASQTDGTGSGGAPAGGAPASNVPTVAQIEMMEGIDDELRQALLLSLQDYGGDSAAAPVSTEAAGDAPGAAAGEDVEMRDGGDEASNNSSEQGNTNTQTNRPVEEETGDRSELTQILQGLPGVDVSDPRLQQALRDAHGDGAGETEKKGDGEKKN